MAEPRDEPLDTSLLTERWQQVKGVLSAALETAPSERSSYLDKVCAADTSLRLEIESLLAMEESSLIALLNPATGLTDAANSAHSRVGRRIGPYQLVEELGSGGMGEVYRAFRADDQYKKEVAIKFVRAGQDSKFVIARFRNERQVLANLDHPNIARLLDGGTTDDGIPYFVMELIQGQPLTEYCDTHKLPTTERLKLFLEVCSAVQYAHQRLIIHRDLKPGNILVTDDGTPKLLDFGIAKILGPAPSQIADATMSIFRLLTPAYASPEQVKGETITTASDVYSLGVVLYECLTGHRPYASNAAFPHDISQAVCEVEPEKPSTIIRRTETRIVDQQPFEITPASVSATREGTPEKLAKQLRGDLDNIVLTALRKEPQRRFTSVEQFAGDIHRHLQNLPVTATRDTLRYRTTKFIARHKTLVAAAIALFAVVLAGVSATLYEAHRARLNELRAEKRFNDVRALANSLLFDIHDSIRNLPGSTPARKLIVERALRYLDSLSSEAAGDPSLERELATAYERVGEVQGDYVSFSLGQTQNALRSYRKSLTLRKSVAVSKSATWEDQLALAKAYKLVGKQMQGIGDVQNALQNIQASISISELLRKTHPQDKQVLTELANGYQRLGYLERGSWTQAWVPVGGSTAIESFGKALEIDKSLLQLDPNNEHFQLAAAADEMYYAEALPPDRTAEKLQHFQHVLETDQSINKHAPSPENARNVAVDYTMIGFWYDTQRDHAKSAENHAHSVDIYEHLLAADPQNNLVKRYLASESGNLGFQLGVLGQKKESERLLDKAITLMQSTARANPQDTSYRAVLATGLAARADNFLHWKNFKAGLDDYGAAIDIYHQLLAPDPKNVRAHIRLLICRIAVAHTKMQMRDAQAKAELESAVTDLKPYVLDPGVNDDTLYAAAVGYADLANIDLAAARNAATAAKKSYLESAIRWYGSSLSTLNRVHDLAGQSESEAFGPLNPASVSRQLTMCESALRVVPTR